MHRKGFTITEVLIALAIVGILVAILMPIIFNMIPDRNAMMAKRAYYAVQTVSSSLLNDEACYPDTSNAMTSDKRIGFDDGYGYADCSLWGGQENTGTIQTEGDPNEKFLTLFKSKLDVKEEGVNTFTTKDGIHWTMQKANMNHSNSSPSLELVVDVNGDDKPNCGQSYNASECENKKEYDTFTIRISADGTLNILDNWAKKAVEASKDVLGDEDDKQN